MFHPAHLIHNSSICRQYHQQNCNTDMRNTYKMDGDQSISIYIYTLYECVYECILKRYTCAMSFFTYHGPPKLTFFEVFMVNNLVFRWPKPLFFMVWGAHGIYIFGCV